MSAEALRRRMAHGNIYPAEKVDAALGHYFRVGNLAALRELALLWVADRVEDSLQTYMSEHGISGSWETARAGAGGHHPGRPAAIISSAGPPAWLRRSQGDVLGVYVVQYMDGLARARRRPCSIGSGPCWKRLGGSYHEVTGGDVSSALVGFAAAHHATQLVLGTSGRSRWAEWTRGSVINSVIPRVPGHRRACHLDRRGQPSAVKGPRSWRLPVGSSYSVRRVLMGFLVAFVSLGALVPLLARYSVLRPHP